MRVLRITDWDKRYETAETRKLKRLGWVPVPVQQDGLGYGLMVQGENGPAAYAGFVACLLVAAKSPRRGYLIRDDGKPHTPATLAVKTQLQPAVIELAITRTTEPDVGWLEWVELEDREMHPENREKPGDAPGEAVKNGMRPGDAPGKRPVSPVFFPEQNRTEPRESVPVSSSVTRAGGPAHPLTPEAFRVTGVDFGEEEPWDGQAACWELATKLNAQWPGGGPLDGARRALASICERTLNRREIPLAAPKTPQEALMVIESRFWAHAAHWRAQRARDARCYVPPLAKWIADLDWLHSAPGGSAQAAETQEFDRRRLPR